MNMNSKLLAFTACLLIGCACAQDNQSLYTGLAEIGSSLNNTEFPPMPPYPAYLQQLIDGAQDCSFIRIPSNNHVLNEPLYVNKNITLFGSPFAVINAQRTSQILRIDNSKVRVTMEHFLVIHGKGDYGGAIASQAKSLTIRGCSFSGNLAEYGAAIYQKGGNLKIEDSTFDEDNATVWGAAVYDERGDMQVESSKFTQNPESYVIYVNGTHIRNVNASIIDCYVSDNPGPYNDRTSGSGGAIVCVNPSPNMIPITSFRPGKSRNLNSKMSSPRLFRTSRRG
jgi:hypothetical protein